MIGNNKEWLQNLKPGDKVIVKRQRYRGDIIGVVERITKTLLILENGTRFRRRDGNTPGDGYYSSLQWLREYSQEEGERIEREQTVRRMVCTLNNIQWENLPLNVLLQVEALVKGVEKENG